MATTIPMHARKVYSAITTYKLRKSNYLAIIFSVIYGNNIRLYFILIFLCFGLYLGLIVSGPNISPHKGSIRVYFSLESM